MQIDYAKKIISTIEKLKKVTDTIKENGNGDLELRTSRWNGSNEFSAFTLYFSSKELVSNSIGLNEKLSKVVIEFLNDNKIQLLNKLQESLTTEVILEKQRMVADLVDDLSLINKF